MDKKKLLYLPFNFRRRTGRRCICAGGRTRQGRGTSRGDCWQRRSLRGKKKSKKVKKVKIHTQKKNLIWLCIFFFFFPFFFLFFFPFFFPFFFFFFLFPSLSLPRRSRGEVNKRWTIDFFELDDL